MIIIEKPAAQNHVQSVTAAVVRTEDGREYCMAMYDYEATSEEELSFMEGDIITILKKEGQDVDDGWWEGEVNDQTGVFPCILVEACTADGVLLSDGEVSYDNFLKLFLQ